MGELNGPSVALRNSTMTHCTFRRRWLFRPVADDYSYIDQNRQKDFGRVGDTFASLALSLAETDKLNQMDDIVVAEKRGNVYEVDVYESRAVMQSALSPRLLDFQYN